MEEIFINENMAKKQRDLLWRAKNLVKKNTHTLRNKVRFSARQGTFLSNQVAERLVRPVRLVGKKGRLVQIR